MGDFSSSIATAPPPPSEVKIRTMRSDLESMSKSGGGLPSFQNVMVGSAAPKKAPVSFAMPAAAPTAAPVAPATMQPAANTNGGIAAPKSHRTSILVSMIITVIFIVALALAGWFVYTKFFNKAATPSTPASQASPAEAPSTPTAPTSSQSNSAIVPIMVLPSTSATPATSSTP